MATSTWSAEMDQRLKQMSTRPEDYAEAARKSARASRVVLIGVRKGNQPPPQKVRKTK